MSDHPAQPCRDSQSRDHAGDEFDWPDYELLDLGAGRRLERFGRLVLDRPCPAAGKMQRARPELWDQAHAWFLRGRNKTGKWKWRTEPPERWTIHWREVAFELKLTEFGHLGVFPEQAANWRWLQPLVAGRLAQGKPCRVLNLFAYTGGSTMACAASGAEVTHVDAAKNVVAWARKNAELAELDDRPIRWIAEDAWKYVRRELRRGNRYDGVILDPPSYGHGPRGEVFRLSKHLRALLASCFDLLAPDPAFFLLTCHTPRFSAQRLARLVREINTELITAGQLIAEEMTIPVTGSANQRALPSGVAVTWSQRDLGAQSDSQ